MRFSAPIVFKTTPVRLSGLLTIITLAVSRGLDPHTLLRAIWLATNPKLPLSLLTVGTPERIQTPISPFVAERRIHWTTGVWHRE